MRILQALFEYVSISPEKFQRRTAADQTYKNYADQIGEDFPKWLEQFDPTQKNKYVNWMITKYMKGQIKRVEDIPARIASALDTYDRLARTKKLKPEHKDINQITDLESVIELYTDAEEEAPQSKKERAKYVEEAMYANGDAELVYNDSEYKIVIPKTHKASCYFGKNTRWCTTSANNDYYHNMYSSDGPLYVILHKPENERWQFHFESDQFMDEDDDGIDLDEFFSEHDTVMNALINAGAGQKIDNGLVRLGSVAVYEGKAVSTEVLARKNPEAAGKFVKEAVSSRITIEGGVFEHEGTMYVILETYSDVDSLSHDTPTEYHGYSRGEVVSLRAALENMENAEYGHFSISNEDIEMFIEYHMSDSNKEWLYNEVEMKMTTEKWGEHGYEFDDEYTIHDLGISSLLDVIDEEEGLEQIKYMLHDAALAGYESGQQSAYDEAVRNAFSARMSSSACMLFFYNDGGYGYVFDYNSPIVAAVDISEVIYLAGEDVYYSGWFDTDSDEFMVRLSSNEAEFDEEAANSRFEDEMQ